MTSPLQEMGLQQEQIDSIKTQLAHSSWHGEAPDHWHVGVVALDSGGVRTEDIRELYGYRVYRVLELPRNSIVLVVAGKGCHDIKRVNPTEPTGP